MIKSPLTTVDRIDDLVYEFFKESDVAFLREKPEYRFLLLSRLLNDLCNFNLSDNRKSFDKLKLTGKEGGNDGIVGKSKEIYNIIQP